MQENLKKFVIKSGIFIGLLLLVIILFKFPIDYFNIRLLSSDSMNRIFSKSDALKVLGVAVIFFTMYYKKKIEKIWHGKNNLLASTLFILLGIIAVGFYYFLRYLGNIHNITGGKYFYIIYISSFLSLALAFLSFAIGVYSWDYLKRFVSALRKELIIATVLTIITYILLMQFQALWYFFSYNVTMILYWLFTPLFPTYLEVGQTPIIDVNGFVVSIGPPCSGTESMFLFMVFSIGLYLLDKEKIKTRLFIIVSVIGLIGVYFVNILRLFLLILTGIYVNPDFAVGMFHTNIGWLLFVVYFLVYYYIMRKFIYKHNISKR